MVRHYDGSTDFEPFDVYYGRTLQSREGSVWDFSRWIPDVVVLSLGRNDFSTPLGANDSGIFSDRADLVAQFKAAYEDMLEQLRESYPGVLIINVPSNLWPDDEFRPAVMELMADQADAGHTDLYYYDFMDPGGFGCGWHPDLATQAQVGMDLAELIADLLR